MMTIEKKRHLFDELQPSKELTLGNEHWFLFSPEQTGITLVGMEDLNTGVVLSTTLTNPGIRSASLKAWAGARHSRSSDHPWEIMHEIVEKNVDADKKMGGMFLNYGHASVADMASLQVDLTNVPMHLCFEMFSLSSINSGQEKSTRYQGDFAKTKLHPISNYLPEAIDSLDLLNVQCECQNLADESLDVYARQKNALENAFINYYKPTDEKELNSLRSRVMDCVRSSLLLGNLSGMSFESSARDFSRIIGFLKSSPVRFYQDVGNQMEKFLAPGSELEDRIGYLAEAPSLIRHTEPQLQINQNIKDLEEYLVTKTNILSEININTQFLGYDNQSVELLDGALSSSEKMVSQYIMSIWPGLEVKSLYNWIASQTPDVISEISLKIFRNQNNYSEMPEISSTSDMTLHLSASIGEIRDLNRHRAWGRFATLPTVFGTEIDVNTAYQVLAKGFTLPSYLTDVREFENIGQNFKGDLENYYKNLYKFVGLMERTFGNTIDYSFVINLLPMAHKMDFFMHGDPKQTLYMTHQRSRNGGHINYRLLAYEANQLVANTNPSMEGVRLEKRPDPANREQFFDRS